MDLTGGVARRLAFEGAVNFRDLGGYVAADGRRVRPGLVFRSAHLGGLTTADCRTLAQLGVRTIVDLRGLNEAAETPHAVSGLEAEILAASIEPRSASAICQSWAS